MSYRAALPLLLASLGACVAPAPVPPENMPEGRPLEVLPADAGLTEVRSDLLATARDRYGAAAFDRAMAAPTHLIVKRFAGMAPPPPPGAGPDWRVPTPSAMLIREGNQWLVATASGWRPAAPEAARQIEALIGSSRFWAEEIRIMPCPDFGASNLLLKVPGRAETVRNAMCSSAAADLVQAALGA